MYGVIKPGQRTTEFLASAATIAGLIIVDVVGNLPTSTAAKTSGWVVGAYAVSRGLAKLGAYLGRGH